MPDILHYALLNSNTSYYYNNMHSSINIYQVFLNYYVYNIQIHPDSKKLVHGMNRNILHKYCPNNIH